MIRKYILVIFTITNSLIVSGQIDSLKLSVEGAAAVGIDGHLPFHVGHNRYGRLDPNSNDGYIQPSFYLPINIIGDLKIETGVDYVIKPDIDQSFFHQGFVNLTYDKIELRFGKNQNTNDWYNDDLGSGNLFRSRNSRTITRVEGGIYEYTPIPFFKYIEVKGMISVGWLEDERVIKDAKYHEIFAYLKTAKLPINPFIGINHNALYGGTKPDGTPLPSNFWEVFFASNATGSNNPSDSINAAGAHFGVFDLGFEIPFKNNLFKASFQQPISDGSGISSNFTSNKDYILYLELEFDDHPFIKSIVYENINTLHQSGEGTYDPIVNGQFYTIGQLLEINDKDQFLFDQYGIETTNVSDDEYLDIIRVESNFGYNWGGRDDYYNNGQYPLGNTFHRMNIGNALFTNADRFNELTGLTTSDREFIINNRIVGHHIGIATYYKNWDFNFLFTLTYNYGTYAGKYGGFRGSWNLDREYYFLNAVGMQYLGLNVLNKNEKFDFFGSLGYDSGDFGTSFGALFGVKYKILN